METCKNACLDVRQQQVVFGELCRLLCTCDKP